jgi:hypothetical protein
MRFLRSCFLLAALPVAAHVGSPDIFYQGDAGPYRLLVTVRPPQVVPGVADVEIRAASADAAQIRIVPLVLGFKGPQYAPVPDLAKVSPEDRQFFTGVLWLMTPGSWQVQIDVDGALGHGRLAVPVPALATRMYGMQRTLEFVLIPLGLVLCVGLVSIAGAAVRDAMLEPGAAPDSARVRRSRIVMGAATLIVLGAVWLGNSWWTSEAGNFGSRIFKPLQLKPSVQDGGRLSLDFINPGWMHRRTDDFLPDHGHLMHLYVIRIPQMDLVWHLHPSRQDDGAFAQLLPAMPAGRYALYGDVVHEDGLAETATAEMDLPQIAGHPLEGDDAGGAGPPAGSEAARTASPLPGGYRMVWERAAGPLHATKPYDFRFRLEDPQGKPADQVELYMGMLGHAAFVSTDRTVFAHVHPTGSVPMPAIQLAQPDNPHAGHVMFPGGPPPEVGFPYGFPKPGAYRIFVQMKRAGAVATGIFDAQVEK